MYLLLDFSYCFFKKKIICVNVQGLPGDPGDPGLPGEPGPQIFIGTEFYSFCFAGVSFFSPCFSSYLKTVLKLTFSETKFTNQFL